MMGYKIMMSVFKCTKIFSFRHQNFVNFVVFNEINIQSYIQVIDYYLLTTQLLKNKYLPDITESLILINLIILLL